MSESRGVADARTGTYETTRIVEALGCSARCVFCPHGPGNGGHQVPTWCSKCTMEWFLAY